MNNSLTHLDAVTATDLARDLLPDDEKWMADRHLEICAECSGLVNVLRRMYSITRSMHEEPIPESWIDAAENVFTAGMLGSIPSLPARIAQLITDSFYQPREAEVRNQTPRRRLTYVAGGCSIDLQIEAASDSGNIDIVGQIVAHDIAELSGKPIFLLHRRRLSARSTITQFGEFQMTIGRQNDLRLAFSLGHEQIEIPLDPILTWE